jgi:hypothetical protein
MGDSISTILLFEAALAVNPVPVVLAAASQTFLYTLRYDIVAIITSNRSVEILCMAN